MKILKLLIVLYFGFSTRLFAQQIPNIDKYIIITFFDKFKISFEAPRVYYWIIAQDSTKTYQNSFSHLIIGDFSKNNLVDCCNGKDVDPSIIMQGIVYDYESIDYKGLNELKQIITKKHKKIQTIIKKWESGQKETVTIFATSVSGRFCSSNFHTIGQHRTGYNGKVFIPYSAFTYEGGFWETEKAKFILKADYSKIKFDIIGY